MSNSTYERNVDAIVGKMDSEEFALYHGILRKLESGFYPAELVAAIFQDHWGNPTISTAFAFAKLWAQIVLGEVILTPFQVGILPNTDKNLDCQRDALLSAMNKWLPTEISQSLGGVPQGSDGTISFPDFQIEMWDDIAKETLYIMDTRLAKPISLEIGTTNAAKTFSQIETERVLARWPYQSDKLWLFYKP